MHFRRKPGDRPECHANAEVGGESTCVPHFIYSAFTSLHPAFP